MSTTSTGPPWRGSASSAAVGTRPPPASFGARLSRSRKGLCGLSSRLGCSCPPGLLHVPAASEWRRSCSVLIGLHSVQGPFPWGLFCPAHLPPVALTMMHRTRRSECASFRCSSTGFFAAYLGWDLTTYSIPLLVMVRQPHALRMLPRSLMACKQMLVLFGQTFQNRLWCAWELFTLLAFSHMEQALERIALVPVDVNYPPISKSMDERFPVFHGRNAVVRALPSHLSAAPVVCVCCECSVGHSLQMVMCHDALKVTWMQHSTKTERQSHSCVA